MRRSTLNVQRKGLTLIEVLTSLTIMGILSVGVSMLYVQAVGLYKRGTREATAHDKARLAMERMIPEIREAYNVDYPGPEYLAYTMPARSAGGEYVIDATTRSLAAGVQVQIYQGNASAQLDPEGHYIWRAQRPSPDAGWTVTSMIMDEIDDLSFTYAPNTGSLDVVRITITVGEDLPGGYFNRTEEAEVEIRNH